MYKYSERDVEFLNNNVSQFSKQLKRHLNNELDCEKFKSLRLRNGLYKQLHAYMLRIAVPYGEMNSKQLRALALIADKYDKGYGHFTTRQNIQFNWIKLEEVPAIFKELAKVGMHAMQTSGKLVRNITADYMAGICEDEIADPRPYCEIIRKWFTMHPEFSWLGGKFKIAVNGANDDRTAFRFNDLGLKIVRNSNNELGFEIYVGGGLGAAAMVGEKIRSFLPTTHILSYIESILRVYNFYGRRDHPKRNRIKFLVRLMGIAKFKQMVEDDWNIVKTQQESDIDDSKAPSLSQLHRTRAELQLADENLAKVVKDFTLPIKPINLDNYKESSDSDYKIWRMNNVCKSKVNGYFAATISLAAIGKKKGNINSKQLNALAVLIDKYSCGEIRSTIKQNLVVPHVRRDELYGLWQDLDTLNLADPHLNTIANIVCCPGADYCSLAKTYSISLTTRIQQKFSQMNELLDSNGLSLNISGCENSCAHHHVADIGLLGLNKGGKDFYQITLAGRQGDNSAIGKKLGASINADDVVTTVEKIVAVYTKHKHKKENFSQVFDRIGMGLFKEAVYGN